MREHLCGIAIRMLDAAAGRQLCLDAARGGGRHQEGGMGWRVVQKSTFMGAGSRPGFGVSRSALGPPLSRRCRSMRCSLNTGVRATSVG